jgi:hypothetical protein
MSSREDGEVTETPEPQPPPPPKVHRPVLDSIPSSLHILLRKLKFISMTESGQRPMFSCMQYSPPGLYGAITRTYYSESRTSLLASINQTYDECARVLQDNSKHTCIIVEHIEASREGIERLSETYQQSPDVVSSLAITLVNIDILITKYKR